MSRHWKEILDTDKHRDYMSDQSVGGRPPVPARDNLVVSWVYFVEVCSFTFEFHSLEQLRYCLEHFRVKIHPSDREALCVGHIREHYWQPWYQRLPQRLFEETKRKKVVQALERALSDFVVGKGERR